MGPNRTRIAHKNFEKFHWRKIGKAVYHRYGKEAGNLNQTFCCYSELLLKVRYHPWSISENIS